MKTLKEIREAITAADRFGDGDVENWFSLDDVERLLVVAEAANRYRLASFANARRASGMTLREARANLFAALEALNG